MHYKVDYERRMQEAGDIYGASAPHKGRASAGEPTLRRLAKELITAYLNHANWQAHDGVFASLPMISEQVAEPNVAHVRRGNERGTLKKLAGVRLSTSSAREVWPRILDHKWYLSERLGRDVGLRVAAVDYFENIERPQPVSYQPQSEALLPKLPMMLSLGERP